MGPYLGCSTGRWDVAGAATPGALRARMGTTPVPSRSHPLTIFIYFSLTPSRENRLYSALNSALNWPCPFVQIHDASYIYPPFEIYIVPRKIDIYYTQQESPHPLYIIVFGFWSLVSLKRAVIFAQSPWVTTLSLYLSTTARLITSTSAFSLCPWCLPNSQPHDSPAAGVASLLASCWVVGLDAWCHIDIYLLYIWNI